MGCIDSVTSLSVALAHQVEHLLVARSDGNNDQAPFLELIHQRLRNAFRGTGDDDLVERRMFRPALESVADLDVDVGVAEFFECPLRRAPERFDDFDGVDFLDQAAQHGRLVSATRADFQHAVGGLRVDRLGHERHDEGRRDGLLFPDGQGHVLVGQFAGRPGNELVARCPRMASMTREFCTPASMMAVWTIRWRAASNWARVCARAGSAANARPARLPAGRPSPAAIGSSCSSWSVAA